MKISEVVGRDSERLAATNVNKNAKRISQQASSAQKAIKGSSAKQPVANVAQPCVPQQNRTPKANQLQPSVVKQQANIGKVVGQIAASDRQQPPTEDEKILAMWAFRDMQKQTDMTYAQRLRQQLAAAEKKL